MKMRKAIKSLFALGTGVLMLGASMFGAMAASYTLADYPKPFVEDGKFNALIVVGDNAAASDVVGAIDLAFSLQYAAKKKKTVSTDSGSTTTTTVEGDAFKIYTDGNYLNLREPFGGANGVVNTITSDDLEALKTGSLRNSKGTFTYNQYIDLPANARVLYTSDSDRSDDPELYAYFPSGSVVYTYKLSFTPALKSSIADTNTDSDTQADNLKDLEGKSITMLGKKLTILKTKLSSDGNAGNPDILKLTLMGGDVTTSMYEGDEKTITVNGEDYDVKVLLISDNSNTVKFQINGEVTDELAAGDTYQLSDGTEIGVKEVIPNEAREEGAGKDLVEFYLGADKIVLEDDLSAGTAGSYTVGDDTLGDISVDMTGSGEVGDNEATISEIKITYTSSDDLYIKNGEKLSSQLDSDKKDDLLFRNLDFMYSGLTIGKTDEVKVYPATNDKFKLEYTNADKKKESFYVAYRNTNAGIYLGEKSDNDGTADEAADRDLYVTEGTTGVMKYDYFVVESNKHSHVIQIVDFDTTNDELTLKDIGENRQFKVSYPNGGGAADFYMNGYKYTLTVNAAENAVTLTEITDDAGGVSHLWTENGAKITLTENDAAGAGLQTNDNVTITITEDQQDDDSSQDSISMVLSHDTSNNYIKVNEPTITDANAGNKLGNAPSMLGWTSIDNKETAYTDWGTFVYYNSKDKGKVEITYPKEEVKANVYVTSGVVKTETSESSGNGVTYYETQKIDVGAAKLASEVDDVSAQNLIVVGGPCANSVAATIMGNPSPCGKDFEPGKAFIKLYEQSSGKYALLVAGYDKEDTRRATSVLAQYSKYADKLKGNEVIITKSSTGSVEISQPTSKTESESSGEETTSE